MPVRMLRKLTLAGAKYVSGQEIPETVWDGLRERSRRSLVAGRYVTLKDAPKRKTTTPAGAPKGPGQSPKKGS